MITQSTGGLVGLALLLERLLGSQLLPPGSDHGAAAEQGQLAGADQAISKYVHQSSSTLPIIRCVVPSSHSVADKGMRGLLVLASEQELPASYGTRVRRQLPSQVDENPVQDLQLGGE